MNMPYADRVIDKVRASRGGHIFHERWAARRALQLVFPNDNLFAIAVEGISSTETASPGVWAEEIADLVLYYGSGDNFQTCERFETVQFKYKYHEEAVTASYLKKTIEKFSNTISGYEKEFSVAEVDEKASFIFVTNAKFKDSLSDAINSLIDGREPSNRDVAEQVQYLMECCAAGGLADATRLFSKIVFRAGEKSLSSLDNSLKRTLTDWSAGTDAEARMRLQGLQDLVLKKAGPSGQRNNLIRREDVLDALDCAPEDLFPADTRFIDVETVIERSELSMVHDLIKTSEQPIFVDAEGGVGKTVFVQSLSAKMANEFEVVVFDCFGGGSYRSDNHSRHLPRIGLVQIINELASRTLCDPILPSGEDSRKVIKAVRKRLAQAAIAIRSQSEKLGLLIVVDAADNAQLEAEHRHEEAFPKLLLATIDEDPIDGVKLVLTARTHRKDEVIGRSVVNRVELGPFTDTEAREFLKDRKPDASGIENATALARSGRNARVLTYLVQTWDTNVSGSQSFGLILVPEIIAQRCKKIVSDLHIAGWPDSEITEFFVALSLLPPPIPLNELANALGWSAAQVGTAASDLAPMLEIASHGAIFRDEPTETYIRETYSEGPEAQSAIADRLLASQATSAYAAEALPHFLVVIKDSDRAFALVDSNNFPTTVQSEFGRRRLILVRLRAAFRLAVAEDNLDRVLGLSMRLAQAATANIRGDQFIRRSPALAIVLGGADSYRRLFADRSGWRGARSARLTVAHRFSDNAEEAEIQCESTVRWINWHAAQEHDETHSDHSGPGIKDFAAVLFQHCVAGKFDTVDHNLVSWKDQFSRSASGQLLQLLELFDQTNGIKALADFVSFAASDKCKSKALKLRLLSQPRSLTGKQVKALAKAIEAPASAEEDDDGFSTDSQVGGSDHIVQAALTALFYSSRVVAVTIIRHAPPNKPSAYDYSERYGSSKAWSPIICACTRAWSAGRAVTYHDLLPREVSITKQAKAVTTEAELLVFLKKLHDPTPGRPSKKTRGKQQRGKFSDRECKDIGRGIELALQLTRPIEEAVLTRNGFSAASVTDFLDAWRKHLRESVNGRTEVAADLLVRTVGLGCIHILLNHASSVSEDQAMIIISLISTEQFSVQQKTSVLGQLSHRPALHELAGRFAQHVAEEIGKDDDIEQRGGAYADLAAALVPMSIDEAREYYRQGLAQLDQMGGESYEQIYSLLRFASVQRGGFLKPELSHRLMNLCQTIVRNEPSKFGWTLLGRAAANSIGFPAIAKMIRWHDQGVADISYGLPQLACFLTKSGNLDPRRAAFILTICEDHGWWDWRSGDAVADLLSLSEPDEQRRIFVAIIEKLRVRYSFGAWPSLWDGFLETADKFPIALTTDEREVIEQLKVEAQRKQDEFNGRDRSQQGFFADQTAKPSEEVIDSIIAALVSNCDPSSAHSIDKALTTIKDDNLLPYNAHQRFIARLRASCPYTKRLSFLFAVCDAATLSLTQSLDILAECLTAWSGSSTHTFSNATALVERLFESKIVELFDGQFTDIVRGIHRLSELCNDKRFVVGLVLRKVAAEEVELDGDEWLQLATALCDVTEGKSGLDALELLLSGPASRIADEIGEGPFRPEQAIERNEAAFFADVIWHLLGDDDAYLRWTVARGLNTLAELGLNEEFGLILDRFDQRQITHLTSLDRHLPFQNSRQWLLMGLARIALHQGGAMRGLRSQLLALAQRSDLHVIYKVHIARCLRNIGNDGLRDAELEALLDRINRPPCGIATSDGYPGAAKATSNFHFDYEFTKHEISTLSRLFNLEQATVEDAIAVEIVHQWPDVASLDDFPGRQRYDWDLGDRYESYREHVQRHALLDAATTLSMTRPVVVRSYEVGGVSPWMEWRDRYDITFDDGSWLSDRKDPVPEQAKKSLLGKRIDQQETLQDQHTVLRKLGLVDLETDALIPLYGRWSSPDGVYVKITSALTDRKGAITRCTAFAKRPSHDIWLPEFWDEGYYDRRHRQSSIFEPLVWAPETHSLGIDVGEEIAAEGPAGRPRLGIDLTKALMLRNEFGSSDWHTTNENLALRSQVWGNWKPDPDHSGSRHHDDGEVLWVSPDWLAETLASFNKRLVYVISLWKYRSSRDYAPSNGVKSVLVGLRLDDGTLRFWHAKKASMQD